jgi:glycerophosphoryl diester phosphodiesterase
MHDVDLVRTTDVKVKFPHRSPWTVESFTLSEIKQLDAGSWFSTSFAGEKVPTLFELLAYLKGHNIGLHLEMKTAGSTASLTSIALIEAGWVVDGKPVKPLIVTSFDLLHIKLFRSLQPAVETGFNLNGAPTAARLKELEQEVNGIAIPFSAINDPILSSGISPLLSRVGVYTVNNVVDMDEVLRKRFAYIFTDQISLLIDRISKIPPS